MPDSLMKQLICFIFTTLCLLVQSLLPAFAQSGRLPWVDGEFPPQSPEFDYHVARGEGQSLRAARSDAFNSFLIDLGNLAGVTVTSSTLSEIKSDLRYQNGGMDYREGESSTTTWRIDREGFKVSFLKVGEYSEQVRAGTGTVWHVWELYEVSSQRSFDPYIPEYTDRYGTDAFWRSMLIPGWGQLYKGTKTKGGFIIGGEIALVGGLVATESIRASYMKKIAETHNADHIRTYARKADTMENARNLCIAGAAALYLYNLIDAVASPGNRHLITRNKHFAVYPVAGEAGAGIGLAVNF
jgi:hypothetical protein